MAMAMKRLAKEAQALDKDPPANIRAKPMENDLLVFHYVIEGTKGTPFEGGHFHGQLRFPPEYPLKPPSVLMLTPNGRFQPGVRLCLSMSDYHPETWNPVWSVGTILVGLLSFMNESADTVGSVKTSDDVKRRAAAESLEYNLNNKEFVKLFPELVELADARRQAAAAVRADREAAGGVGAASRSRAGRREGGLCGGLFTTPVMVGLAAAVLAAGGLVLSRST